VALAAGSRPLAAPVVNGAVLRARERLEVLLWCRDAAPPLPAWALPGGFVAREESLEAAMRRHLLDKVGVAEVAHLEQLTTVSRPDTHPELWVLDTAYLALTARDADPPLPADTSWHPIDALPPIAFGHEAAVRLAHERLRGKLSYSNIAFALAAPRFTMRELAGIYQVVLGYPVAPSHLRRVLDRDGLLAATSEQRPAGREGGRPAALFAFRERELTITRPLAAFRPPRPAPEPAPAAATP
jgi:ADP-ribose pyrophosphatase YjhB (NUDIX family)